MSIRARGRALLRRPEVRNFLWLLVEYGSRLFLTVGTTALVARHLGPEQFAAYGLLYTLIGLVLPLSDAGLANVISRAIVAEERPEEVVLGTAAAIRVVACLVAVPVLGVLAWASGDDYPDLIRFALLAGVLNAATSMSVIDYYYQAHLQARVPALARMGVLTLLGAAQLALVLSDAPPEAFLLALCLQQPLFGVAYALHYRIRARVSLRTWRVEREYLGVLFHRSMRMVTSNVMESVALRLPVIVLAQAGTPTSVSLLAAAMRPVDMFRVLPNAASASILPRMVRTFHQDRAAFDGFLRRMTLLFLAAGGLMSLGFAVAGPFLAEALFGPEFDGAGRVMQIYGLVLVFVSARVVFTKWVVVVDQLNLNVLVQACGAVVSVVLSVVLVGGRPTAVVTATVLVMQAASTNLVAPLLHPAGRAYLKTIFWPPARRREVVA
jgi:PST family polysaccharide transporter